MRATLLTNSLFKTTEYRIGSSSKLEITELSPSRIKSKTVSLNSLNVRVEQTSPILFRWLLLIMAFATSMVVMYFGRESNLLYINLFNTISIFSCVFGLLWFVNRPKKSHIYTDCFTNNILFKLNTPIAANTTTESFVTKLDNAIENAKNSDSNLINLKSNARSQYEIHHKNVNDLMNSGLIDEVLHTRICNSMQESVLGSVNDHETDNVVYLHR